MYVWTIIFLKNVKSQNLEKIISILNWFLNENSIAPVDTTSVPMVIELIHEYNNSFYFSQIFLKLSILMILDYKQEGRNKGRWLSLFW